MEIVDSQIHMGPGGIDETLAAMDALGISAALIDEYWVREMNGQPYDLLANGAQRPVSPTADLAARLHPDRFAYLQRFERGDDGSPELIRRLGDNVHCRALRITPGMSPDERARFAQGEYDHILAAACEAGLPVFVFEPDTPSAMARAAQEFPDLKLIVDHCGIYNNSMRTSFADLDPLDDEAQLAMFDRVVALSEFPNVALKWGHASSHFDQDAWPGEGLWPVLRRAIAGFGADRIMWASDHSVNQRGESWAELLFGVRGNPDLSDDEAAAIFGGTARSWLDWSG